MSDVSVPTETFVLRDHTEQDFPAIHAFASNSENVKMLPWGPNSEEDSRRYLQEALEARRSVPRKLFRLAIMLRQTGQVVGGCSIELNEDKTARVGYVFDKSYDTASNAAEVLGALLGCGFDKLAVETANASCLPDDLTRSRALEKVGMRCEGRVREHKRIKDRWWDSLDYSIVAERWQRSCFM